MNRIWTAALGLVFTVALAGQLHAQASSLSESFTDITTLPGSGWVQSNQSQTIGSTNWFQGNQTVFVAQSGGPTEYIAANFNNTTGADTISNWLVTPHLSFTNGGTLTFFTRTVDAPAFPDRLQIRLSNAGTSANTGTLFSDVGDFTTLLLEINPTLTTTGYPNTWTQFNVNIPAGADGRLAFRYFVPNAGPSGSNSDYIGIDTVAYSAAVPEPTTWALMGLCSVAGAGYWHRRRQALKKALDSKLSAR